MIAFPVPTRTTITGVTVSSASHFTLYGNDGGNATGSSISLAAGGTSGAQIDANTASGGSSGKCYTLGISNSSGYIYFTGAEL
jgi:hypothetical protein